MPQEFCVLRCYSCEKFQVHIVKKAKKWDCKMCGSKQSLIKIFGQGDARQCREHVQKLNMETGLKYEGESTYQDSSQKESLESEFATSGKWQCVDDNYPEETPSDYNLEKHNEASKVSKWTCFLEPEDN